MTKEQELVRQAKAKGAVGYSTAHWEGETLADVKHATILVLLEVEPELDESGIAGDPGLLRLLTKQANLLADEMFKRHRPDAVIVRDNVD